MNSSISQLLCLLILITSMPTFASIKVREKTKSGEVSLVVHNKFYTPVVITFSFPELENAKIKENKKTFTVQPKSKTPVITINQVNKNQKWLYKFKYTYKLGAICDNPEEFVYSLPFKEGTVIQKEKNSVAWEVKKAGTPVYCIRDGLVIGLEDNCQGKRDAWGAVDKNFVKVLHDDNTMGGYYYLKRRQLKVKLGQQVKKGTLLGYVAPPKIKGSKPIFYFEFSRFKKGSAYEKMTPRFNVKEGKNIRISSNQQYTAE